MGYVREPRGGAVEGRLDVSTPEEAWSRAVEQYTIEHIPLDQRHGRTRDLFTIWFSSNIMPLTFITGALAPVVFGLSFWWSLIAIVVGNLVGALFMALHSAQGPRLGVPQMIQSRAQFGYLGAVVVVLIAVFMYVGFFASNIILGGQSLHQLASWISVDAGIVIVALGSLVITVFGYDMIHAFNRWAAVFFGAAMVLALVWVVASGLPSDFLTRGGYSWSGFLTMLSIAALWQIAYAPYVSDYSRYMSPEKGAGPTFWASYWGTNLGSIVPMLIGVTIGLASTNPDQIAALNNLTGATGWFIMLVFALGIVDTNSINLYGGVLCSITTGQTFAPSWLPRAGARAVLSVIIVAISLVGALAYQSTFLTNYVNFILLLLYLLIPWTAINLVDYYLIRHGDYDVLAFFDPSGGNYGRVNWVGLGVYVIAILIEIPFINTTLYQGPVSKALNGTDLAWLVGLAVTIPLYYFADRWQVRSMPPDARPAVTI
jgi:NCS1 family nucleobase:cation symporter-1